jgi:hypothetical protein
MAKRKPTIGFETVREIGLALPGVTEATSYGVPALKVRGHMFVCTPANKAAEPDSLVVRLGIEDRDALLAEAPDTYYLKDHYVDYPCVLVRFSRIDRDALADLIKASWRFETETRARKAGRAGKASGAGRAGGAGRTGRVKSR